MPKKSNAADSLTSKAREQLVELGDNIRKARTRRGISQGALALRASMSPVTLGKLERGDPSVGLSVLVMVLDILGLIEDLAKLANPDTDSIGKGLEEARPQKRVWNHALSNKLDF